MPRRGLFRASERVFLRFIRRRKTGIRIRDKPVADILHPLRLSKAKVNERATGGDMWVDSVKDDLTGLVLVKAAIDEVAKIAPAL
jgi:hypothetical protein